MLARALATVSAQKRQADEVIVECDTERTGATATRNRALAKVETDFVAWLDDDDEMLPHHLRVLMNVQRQQDADYVFTNWVVPEYPFILPSFCYGVWDENNPLQTTITTLMRTKMVLDLGGFISPPSGQYFPDGNRIGEDFYLTYRCNSAGYRIVHHPLVTWLWHHHGRNTSGKNN